MRTLKQKVREVTSARNTLVRMGKANHYKNPVGREHLNSLAMDVMDMAKEAHPLLPYYIVTKRI